MSGFYCLLDHPMKTRKKLKDERALFVQFQLVMVNYFIIIIILNVCFFFKCFALVPVFANKNQRYWTVEQQRQRRRQRQRQRDGMQRGT